MDRGLPVRWVAGAARLFALCLALSTSLVGAPVDEGRLAQAKFLWEEFSDIYSREGLASLPKEKTVEVMSGVLRDHPANRLYRERLDGLEGVIEIVGRLAELRGADPVVLLEAALDDFCKSRSKWESYMTASDRELLAQMSKGRAAGAGMQLNRDASGRFSLTPFSGSPAEKAGVLPGDELVGIEGKPTVGLSIPRIKSMVAGPPDTELLIRVRRHSGGEKTLRLRRGFHTEPIVTLEEKYSRYVLRVRTFDKGVAAMSVRELEKLPADSRLVIDLRGNEGGLLTEATAFASLFLPEGAVVFSQRHRDGRIEVVRAGRGSRKKMRSIVCLVDRHTASACELVTAALISQPGTSVQGERTYGKDRIVSEHNLRHGGILTLETSEMLGPTGRTWDMGIDPEKAALGQLPY